MNSSPERIQNTLFCIEEVLGFAPLEGVPFVWYSSAPAHRGDPYITFNPNINIELTFEGLPIHQILFAKTLIEAQKLAEKNIMAGFTTDNEATKTDKLTENATETTTGTVKVDGEKLEVTTTVQKPEQVD